MNLGVLFMDVRDPVCGMRFSPKKAATTTTLGGHTYHFCSASCRDAFVADPERHLDEGRSRPVPTNGAPIRDRSPADVPVPNEPAQIATDEGPGGTCPYCHEATVAGRSPGLGVEGIRLHELEALVRNEWRRRLGPDSYHRRHPPGLIRAVAFCAIHPGSKVLEDALESLIWDEVAELSTEAKSRKTIQCELGELVMAMRAVLKHNGVAWGRVLDLTDPVRRKMEAVLGWPGVLPVSSRDWDV